jgi:hypothetical protein
MEDIVDLPCRWELQSEHHRGDDLYYFKQALPPGGQLPRGVPTFHGRNFDKIHSHMILCAFSCTARASFRASSNSGSLDSRAERKVFPIGG